MKGAAASSLTGMMLQLLCHLKSLFSLFFNGYITFRDRGYDRLFSPLNSGFRPKTHKRISNLDISLFLIAIMTACSQTKNKVFLFYTLNSGFRAKAGKCISNPAA